MLKGKQMKRIIGWMLILVLCMGLCVGCVSLPDFDAAKFLSAALDLCFKNDSTEAVALGINEQESIDGIYNNMLDQTVDSFFSGVSASSELKQRYRDIFADIFMKADYTVKDSQKMTDDSYAVTVSYSKMQVFGPTLKKIRKNLNKLNTTNKDIFIDNYFTLMAESLEKTLSEDLQYGTEEVMVFHIDLVKNKYELNMNDITTLVFGMFDFDAVDKMS